MLSKSGIVGTIIIFYAFVYVMIGYALGNTQAIQTDTVTGGSQMGINNIITGITIIPLWINIILFSTLLIIIIFIVVTSLPTFNGGS